MEENFEFLGGAATAARKKGRAKRRRIAPLLTRRATPLRGSPSFFWESPPRLQVGGVRPKKCGLHHTRRGMLPPPRGGFITKRRRAILEQPSAPYLFGLTPQPNFLTTFRPLRAGGIITLGCDVARPGEGC